MFLRLGLTSGCIPEGPIPYSWLRVGLTSAADSASSLDFYYALASLRLIGLIVLVVDWTSRLDDSLDMASRR